MKRIFQGSMVALVTPFKGGRVDEPTLRELVEFHINNGTDVLVPCGTTGESPTLSHDEHRRVIELTIEAVNRRIAVVAGTGSNSTAEAIDLTRYAKQAGADGALLVLPYYNKPTQAGLVAHCRAVADAAELPLILYNIPGRTGINMLPETLAALADHLYIVGMKEATGNLEQMTQDIVLCGDRLSFLSGDDTLTLPLLAVGGRGVISVVANIVPRDVADLTRAFLSGDWKRAREIHLKLFPLCQAMFYETNPIPVKTAMAILGMVSGELRLPLCPMSEPNLNRLKAAMRAYGLLS
ncbi:dihydrodipicolinate synthase [Candidatus Methylomirabilis lanthanidiphila]|uniref:4-hydroxy-tetrahydrodipicolinate synthase n=1 Tax=Candidatus Methylomirabilis lanthanidiphila TaxID=2211376 RepID=A0A564ZG78_9BACT|nr:4-hydroxy-tetrahydrodipicolinate synthase [Candidatus Methylomirabilis lanthanidiphila]VUZ84173.1 dihydrodipicolinate synthase [Candidatus Methylomirabilis lanthanidiphila]